MFGARIWFRCRELGRIEHLGRCGRRAVVKGRYVPDFAFAARAPASARNVRDPASRPDGPSEDAPLDPSSDEIAGPASATTCASRSPA